MNAHSREVHIAETDYPTKKALDLSAELWRRADAARAALAYEIIGEALPEPPGDVKERA